MVQHINSGFIGNFKLGDNIVYNLNVMLTLYEQREVVLPHKKKLFNKPIILLSASIVEACLYDFQYRVNHFTLEGIASLPKNVIDSLRVGRIDKLGQCIARFKKYHLFDDTNYDIYGKLDALRQLRNRIHIQNERRKLEDDDCTAFSDARLKLTEQCLEFTLRTLSEKYQRPVQGYVAEFVLPFDEHFEERSAPNGDMTLAPK